MPRFRDRTSAGEALADKLLEYKDKNAVVVALPRGGVPVAWPVAKRLNLPLDIVVPRKIGAPGHEEYAIGAITQDKQAFLDDEAIAGLRVPKEYIQKEIEKQAVEASRRINVYRGSRPPLDFAGKTVIIVDDGIATGYTMKAAISSVRAHKCADIVVAVPVGPPDSLQELKRDSIKVVCLQAPDPFGAVGNFYDTFDQTEDEEVLAIMAESENKLKAL